MEWYRKMNVFETRPTEECFEKTINVKLVDRNKGDRQHMNVRWRLMTKQINTGKEQLLFEAIPPLEALRMLLSATVTGNKPKPLMLNDISRAYMYARTLSDIYMEVCEEHKTELGHENICGKAHKVDVWDKGSSA